jgi:centrosomal CEP192-like protein
MRLRPLWLSVIFLALAACGNEEDPPVEPTLFLDRESLGFGQEFGLNAYVKQEITESLYIENQGQQPLEITEVTKSGASQFTLVLPEQLARGEPVKLEYGKRTFLQVVFKPTEAKKYEGKLLIKSNAPNAPQKEILLSGIGVNP